MDRLQFLDSITGIQYPKMIVDFFDQFIALKQIVEDTGVISVEENTQSMISFSIDFNTKENRDYTLNNIQSGNIVIYKKQISVSVDIISDNRIKINLQ